MVDLKRPTAADRDLCLLYLAYREYNEEPDATLAEHRLNRSHHRILFFLALMPGMSVGELLGILKLSKQAINAPLRALSDQGLIEATPAADDRRRKELRLTPTGAELERELARQRGRLGAALDAVGPEKARAWREVMTVLAGEDWAELDGRLTGTDERSGPTGP
ncbi:winged helix-turn-helix transcriptional regulator [Streptomyces sp. AV19]|uniref:MarR family winged helix-turn-helix transcriptional regulator n=1 Tax=Streptomyces sp. AV19 TaxID=2793068 RepID=UPI0018FE97A2|nr:MarR family winged helix-turn-helix transcriptional regulator [Streptomyces sp. AV19]MBH1937947.1 winged helix-turn-helix transcriptional regulator [Streptomyces sp. AV19]MDG4536886.1 MarR family winged helix-turn-helix transcriptional regulator [Streptomyces sp. AV19]